MRGQHLALLAVLAALCEVVCGGVVGGIERQGTALVCEDTLTLDFSSREPQVDCSSPCTDVHTWAAGPVFRREQRLAEFGLMVRQEYGLDGTVTCSLVADIAEPDALQSSLQAEACTTGSPSPTTTTTVGTGSSGSTTVGTGSSISTTAGTGSSGSTIVGTGSSGSTTAGTGSSISTTVGTGSSGSTTVGTGSSGSTTADTGSSISTTVGTGSSGSTTAGTGSSGSTTAGTGSSGSTTVGTGSSGSTTVGTGSSGSTTVGTGSSGSTTVGTGGSGSTTAGTGSSGSTTVGTGSSGSTTVGTGSSGSTTAGTGSSGSTTAGTGSSGSTTAGTESSGSTATGPGSSTGGDSSSTSTEPGTSDVIGFTTTPEMSSSISTVSVDSTTLIECVKDNDPATLPPTSTRSPWVCERGWSLFESSCYKADENVKLDWVQGQYYCQGLNADYAKITSEDQNEFVREFVPDDSWIGLSDINAEGEFVWTDRSTATFFGWAEGEPNNVREEDCIELRKSLGYQWNDSSCSNIKGVLCQKQAERLGD